MESVPSCACWAHKKVVNFNGVFLKERKVGTLDIHRYIQKCLTLAIAYKGRSMTLFDSCG